ncbi:MAG: 2-phosphosulfolactate phosphatase [Zhaonellaceae bacterium]|jgi:2-phosphosulfolactate phosphatase
MELDVVFTADEVDPALTPEKNAVVIDVLRATTTMITSLVNGCETIIPVVRPEDGRKILEEALASGEPRQNYCLGGERGGIIIPGYDLGNSPLEYTSQVIKGKKLIFCTTNGTLAINKAAYAKRLFLGALVNGKSVAQVLKEYDESLLLVCAGTKGSFSLEDTMAAGLIIHELLTYKPDLVLLDRAVAALALFRHHKADLFQAINLSKHAKVLTSLGFIEDIEYCVKTDLFPCVPYFEDGKIKLFCMES